MTISSNLGFPRIGPGRALKWALERYWSGKADEAGLLEDTRRIRHQNWQLQRELGLDHVPSNDFSLYDHVLDTAVMVGAVPELETSPLGAYFAFARGATVAGRAVSAWEMTKWFDTNYHYLVPELSGDTRFRLDARKPLGELAEATAAGVSTRPVLLGPISFLLLAKSRAGGSWDPLEPLPRLVPVYEELLASLAEAGATWVQVDEPMLASDLGPDADKAFAATYRRLADAAPQLRILLAAYFSGLRANLDLALRLPVAAIHLDLVREPSQLGQVLASIPSGLTLSLGVVDGRNVWRADLDAALATLERAAAQLGRERILVAPSCSLLHCPLDVTLEEGLDPELRSWLAFATQKVGEVVTLARALDEGRDAVGPALEEARAARQDRRESPAVHDPLVQRRLSELVPEMEQRGSTHPERKAVQETALRLPVLPTTTIGSYPQTPEVRRARAEFRRGDLD
ncbi:MAG: 5-methyltetrahydropteroyltriglutamate--homocysteine S-methyltransferase, partial [Acidimicrobiia bacterium]